MAGVNIEDFGASFIKYLPKVTKTLNMTSVARKIPKGKMKWSGAEHVEKVVHVGLNGAISFLPDGGNLPAAGQQSYVRAKAYRKHLAGTVQLTDGVLKSCGSSKQSAISVVDSELRGLMESIRKLENFMFTRDGSGECAVIGNNAAYDLGATPADAKINVDDARGLWAGKDYTVSDGSVDGQGNLIVKGSFTVSKVDRKLDGSDKAEVTLSGATGTFAEDDKVYWGTGDQLAFGRCPSGLSKMIDDSPVTFQNIDVDKYPHYGSPCIRKAGGDLAAEDIRQMLAMLKQEGAGSLDGITVLTNVWNCTDLEELYHDKLQITPDTKTLGIAAVKFQSALGSVKVVTDPDSPYGEMFFLDPSEITRLVQSELAWRKNGKNGSIFRASDSALIYRASCMEMHEYMINKRNSSGKISGLSDSKKSAF